MRKTVFIALIISLVLGLIAGCGSMKQSAVTDATTISKQEQASKIDFIRKSIYDKAMSYIDEVMSDEKILEMKDILTTNNGDFGELYNMILTVYKMESQGDWTKNEMILSDLVVEYCEQAYTYASKQYIFENLGAPGGNNLLESFASQKNEEITTEYNSIKDTISEAKEATTIDEIVAITEKISITIGDDEVERENDAISLDETEETGDDFLPIEISSIKVERNSIGTPEVYVVVKNNSDKSIDAFDFRLRGYNNYGELVKNYGKEYQLCTFNSDSSSEYIEPGKASNKHFYWAAYSLDGATKFEVALIKCHEVDGKTYELKESAIQWYSFNG